MRECMTGRARASRPEQDETPTVLLIDDDPAVLDALVVVLEEHGFRVLTACNGWAGLRVFRQHAPKVVVTDLIMPEQDGIGMMLQMRRERPNTKIIAISGGGYLDGWDYLTAAQQLGADATFPKAVNIDALIEKLNELLR